ncbi:MAG: tetratricopeptide repeat-containing sensor histidine kinase, partial [Chitinophagaceae bacterium]
SLKADIQKLTVDSLKIKSHYRLAAKYIRAEDSANAHKQFAKGISIAKSIKKHFWVVYGLNELGYLLEITGNPKAALKTYTEAVVYGRINDILGERARAFSNLSFVYSDLFDVQKSIICLDSSLAIYRKMGMKKNIAANLNNLGSKYLDIQNFEKALYHYNEASIICEEIKDYKTLAVIYLNIGIINLETGKLDIGINYLEKSKKLSANLEDLPNYLLANYNLAKGYHDKKDYNQAIALLEKTITDAEKFKPRKLYGNYLNLLASSLRVQKQYTKAATFFNKALLEMQQQDNKEGIAVNYGNYGAMLGEMGKLDSCIYFNTQALNIANKYNELTKYRYQLFENLAEAYFKQQNYAKAYAYKDSQIVAKALIINDEANTKLLDLQTKYETQQKESKIQLLSQTDSIKTLQIANQQLAINQTRLKLAEQQLALSDARLLLAEDSILLFSQKQTILNNQLDAAIQSQQINNLSKEALSKELLLQKQSASIKQKNNIIIIAFISVLLLVVIAYAVYKRKQLEQKVLLAAEKAKQRQAITEAVIEAEETERKRIAADLHDGVGQLFSAVKMNLQALIDRVDIIKQDDLFLAEKTMALVDESCKEVRVISHKMMPNFLLKSGIASDIRSFIEKIDEQTLKIKFESKGFKDQMEFNEEVILYRVIQELINNVIKHAHANELQISLERNSANINVFISDNGQGFNYEEGKNKGGLGLKNIAVRINYLKGTIAFSANKPKGTKVHINIPVA